MANYLVKMKFLINNFFLLHKIRHSQTIVILTKCCKIITFNVNFTKFLGHGHRPSPNPTPTGAGIPPRQTLPLGNFGASFLGAALRITRPSKLKSCIRPDIYIYIYIYIYLYILYESFIANLRYIIF